MVNEEEIKDWYNHRYLKYGKSAMRPYEAYPIFLDYLNVRTQKKLLDIGCGTGYLLKAADQRGLETYGTDISNEGVKIAQKVSPHSKIIRGKGEELRFPDKFFDYVTCLGALEHFLNIEKGINEMVRVAKDDALFCIVVPNLNFALWNKGKKGTKQQDINETLLSLEEWRNMFEKEKLEIVNIYQDKWLSRKIRILSSLNPSKILLKIYLKLRWMFISLDSTYQFVFILKKSQTN